MDTNTTCHVFNLSGEPVAVYNVPTSVARWIAESFDSLDYIQSSDIAMLATYAVRNRRFDRALFDAISY